MNSATLVVILFTLVECSFGIILNPASFTCPKAASTLCSISNSSIKITGNGSYSYSATSPVVTIKPSNKYYVITSLKCDPVIPKSESSYLIGFASTSTSISGCVSTYKIADLADGWIQIGIFMRPPTTSPSQVRANVGQWLYNGTCLFGSVTILDAEITELAYSSYGKLGSRESITKDGVYTSLVGGVNKLSSYNHQIVYWSTWFNTNNYDFYTGRSVVLSYNDLKTPFLSPPLIKASVNYCVGSVIQVFSGSSLNSLTFVRNLSSVGVSEFYLPSASHKFVKLIANGTSTSISEFDSFKLSADVSVPKASITGNEIILIHKTDGSSSAVSIGIEGGSSFATSKTLPIYIRSNLSTSITVKLLVSPASESISVSLPINPITINPKSNATLFINYAVSLCTSLTCSHTVNLTLQDNSNEAILHEAFLLISSSTHYFLDESYGELLSTSSSSDLWWCGSTYKVNKFRSSPILKTSKVSVSAAIREYEPFQLIIHPKSGPLTIQSITISDLSSSLFTISSKTEISIRTVEYLKTDIATDVLGIAGEYWPDPLTPLELPFVCPNATNCPFWILAYVKEGTPSGIYTGQITVQTNSGMHSTTISLRVYNFSLPKHTKLRTWFGLSSSISENYFNITKNEDKIALWDKYMDSFAKHRMCNPNPMEKHYFTSKVIKASNGTYQWKFNFTDFDANWERYYGEDGFGFNTFDLKIPGMGWRHQNFTDYPGTLGPYKTFTENHTKLLTVFLKTATSKIEEHGFMDNTYVYWYDEPETENYQWVIDGNAIIHNAVPSLKRFLTEQYEEILSPYVEIWSPVLSSYIDGTAIKYLKENSQPTWTYLCCGPKSYLGLFVDHPAIDLRVWLWHTFREQIQGILIWQTNFWTNNVKYGKYAFQDPWMDAMTWGTNNATFGNGDGRFFYPPKDWKSLAAKGPILNDSVIESQRWELLREGIEDWEYLTILKGLIENASYLIPSTILSQAKDLLSISTEIIGTYKQVNKNPNKLLQARDSIGSLIEAIINSNSVNSQSQTEGFGSKVSSAPSCNKMLFVFVLTLTFFMCF